MQTEHRCLAKFHDLNISVAWNQAWFRLRIWHFVRSVQDTAWLTFHRILPTTDRLVQFGMSVNPTCFCGEAESLVNLFTLCPFASEVFQWFTIQLRKRHPTAALTTGQILFGFASASGVPIVFTALLGILRHHVWLARNKHPFEQVLPDVPTTLKNAKSTFHFIVRMHQGHCTREVFDRHWLVDGRLGVVDISQEVLSLRSVWLQRFFSHPHHPWSSFFSQHVASSFANRAQRPEYDNVDW